MAEGVGMPSGVSLGRRQHQARGRRGRKNPLWTVPAGRERGPPLFLLGPSREGSQSHLTFQGEDRALSPGHGRPGRSWFSPETRRRTRDYSAPENCTSHTFPSQRPIPSAPFPLPGPHMSPKASTTSSRLGAGAQAKLAWAPTQAQAVQDSNKDTLAPAVERGTFLGLEGAGQ